MKPRDCPYCNRHSWIKVIDDRECIHTCGACGYHDEYDVECCGIYFCANPLCTMCGASWIGKDLPSRKDDGTGFTVDPIELREARYAFIRKLDREQLGRERSRKLLAFLWARYPDFVRVALDLPLTSRHIDHDPGDEEHAHV